MKRLLTSALLVSASLIFFGCQHFSKKERTVDANLTQTQAQLRSQSISDVKYDLAIDLAKFDNHFEGQVTVNFKMKELSTPLTLDYRSGEVAKLIINGKASTQFTYNKNFIIIPSKHLKVGHNTISIHYKSPYNNAGVGLYKFVDKQDGKKYLYTQFEAYEANLMFPSFDQPDLKATYKLKVTAPKSWQVISAELENKIEKQTDNNIWHFPESKKFSTYVFSLHAGPYKVWKSKAGDIPLRLMARQSKAKYVKPHEWFKITKQGFAYFISYFGYKYPYKKYDQILVPDFNFGAMENVAAVTFNDHMITKSQLTRSQRRRIASTILHEQAHMWFGNLVTMKWWNGLWLNESFATYMATKALYEATEYKEAWDNFYASTKQWAYWEDQLVTTHPIEQPIHSTDEAFASFDGITYGKGASVLKQLAYYVGEENFKKGLQLYFKKHAETNTTLNDFISAQEQSSQTSLAQWTDQWLTKPSLNTVESQYQCQSGKIKTFQLLQTASNNYPTLRQHRMDMSFYQLKKGKLKNYKTISSRYAGERTVVKSAIGEACPDFVLLNSGDFDFVKVSINEQSLKFAKPNIDKFKNNLHRKMIWQSLWDMVRDARLPVNDYLEFVRLNINKEKDLEILKSVATTVVDDYRASSFEYLPLETVEQRAYYSKVQKQFSQIFLKNFKAAKKDSDLQKMWFNRYLKLAATPQELKQLAQWLRLKKVYGMTLDQDKRWDIIIKLNEFNHQDSEKLIALELKKDKSNRAKNLAVSAQIIRPDLATKMKWYQKAIDPNSKITLREFEYIVGPMFPRSQKMLQKQASYDFFKDLKTFASRNANFESSYLSVLPVYCDEESSSKIHQFLDEQQSLREITIKWLKVSAQENTRCINIRKLM